MGSFAPVAVGDASGLGISLAGLDSGGALLALGLGEGEELDENLELRLVIHEPRLPSDGLDCESLLLVGDRVSWLMPPSEPRRGWRWGRKVWACMG